MTAIELSADRTDGVLARSWHRVCKESSLLTDRGVAALVDGRQVAIFAVARPARTEGDRELFAVDHHDPCSDANVLARGLIGSIGAEPSERVVVFSPIHKERFDLRTGECLDADAAIGVHDVRLRDGWIEVRLRPGTGSP